MRKDKERRKENGICHTCFNKVAEGHTLCFKHLRYVRDRTRKVRQQRASDGLCITCGKVEAEKKGQRCEGCRLKRNEFFRKQAKALRVEIISEYGGRCTCCGENDINFLQIDHVNNDGAAHRKANSKSLAGFWMYHWIKKNNYPNTLQVLCANCNFSKKMNGGVCSHQKEKRIVRA